MKKVVLLFILIGASHLQSMNEPLLPELKQKIVDKALVNSNNLNEAAKAIRNLSILFNLSYDNFEDVSMFVKALKNKFPSKSNEKIRSALSRRGSYQSLSQDIKQEIMNIALATSDNLMEAAKAIKQLSVLHSVQYNSFQNVTKFVKALQNKFPDKSNEEIRLALEKVGKL